MSRFSLKAFADREPLLSLLAWNALAGAGVALVLIAAVLATDTARLRTLILATEDPTTALVLLATGFLVTMCSAVMGSAVMLVSSEATPARLRRPRDVGDRRDGG